MINLSFLKRSAELRKIVANTGWLFADKILRMGVGLFVSVWIARYLGVEQFGTLNFAAAFVALFSTLSTLGLPSLVVRSLTHEPAKRNEILGTTFWLQLLGGMAGLGLSVATILLFRREDPLTVSLVAILGSVGIFQAFDTIDLWFQSQVQSRYTVVAKNTAFIIFSLIKIALIYFDASLLAFAIAITTEVAFGALGLVFLYQLQGFRIRQWQWSCLIAKELLSESWFLILSSLTIVIYMKIDQIMLAKMIDDKAVGIYSSAVRISEVWYFIPTSVSLSFSPIIYALRINENYFLYYRRLKQLIRLLFLSSIIIAVPVSLFSRDIVDIIFGHEYIDAGPILSIHIWSGLFIAMGVGTSSYFTAEKLTHLSFRRNLFGGLLNIVLNFFLIPIHGGMGAALATIISYGIAGFLANAFDTKSRKIFEIQLEALFLKY